MKVNLTSYGLARHANMESEDAFGVKVWGETVIAVLADGAGGALKGGEASTRIVKSLVSNYEARPASWSAQKALAEFTKLLNRTLHQESIALYAAPEMVSTLSVAVIEGNRLIGLNVGDSRIYLARDGQLTRLSEDHVHEGMDHVLTRAIGLAPEVELHCFERELSDGDIAFLCSDGITNVLSEDELASRLSQHSAARAIVQHARELATEQNLDDMSAIVLEVAKTGTLRAVREQPLSIPESPAKGGVIDGYELIRPFTGTDRVWLATKDERRWILKFPPVAARDDEAMLERFVKEAWNASRIEGEPFVGAFTPERATMRYYVQEFVEAPSLKMLLTSRRLAVDEAVRLGSLLCDAGARLLALDLVHGDLKPENILAVADYDRVKFKLIDLGSSAEVFSVTSRAGTPSYLAPERFHGAPISERTEIFAIGVTLYEALTRRFPFGEIERFQTPVFHPPKRPGALNANIPAWLDHVILRALSIDPARRYQHYSELAFDLAHPERVEPFYQADAPLLERDPLTFYRTGFWLLLAATLYLLTRLLTH